ncbi:MAG TPA: hypothetical protein VFS09_09025 [Candidatus Eisenbacteria bacterium]|nr:hypothetical protein [Candidatus Eisenbacteria bacterium]
MSGYLRRYRLEPRRPHGRLLVGVLVVMALLLAKVWQSYAANSISMERDRLRGEVRALENRIRLSSELRIQAALREGLDHTALAALGFQNPDPSAVVLIDLSQPVPQAVRGKDGVVARFGGFLQGLPGLRGSGRRPRPPHDETMHALPVDTPIEAPGASSAPEATR